MKIQYILTIAALTIALKLNAQNTYSLTDYCGGSDDYYTNYIPSNRLDSLHLEKCKTILDAYCDSIFKDSFTYSFTDISGIKARKLRDSLELYPSIDSKHSSVRYEILINEFLEYNMYFMLDSNFRIELPPQNIANGHVAFLGQLRSFDIFESDVLATQKGFMKSIRGSKLKFDSEKRLYYYRVNGPTYGKKLNKSKYSHGKKYNFVEINAITGELLNKGADLRLFTSLF